MLTASPGLPWENATQLVQGSDQKNFHKLDGQKKDHRRKINPADIGKRYPLSDSVKNRLSQIAQNTHNGIIRVRIDPSKQRRNDNHPKIQGQQGIKHAGNGLQQIGKNEHESSYGAKGT